MQGNSLISQYEGITLFDETILEDIKSIETEKAEVTQRIATLQSHYFEVHGSEREQALKQEELKKIEKAVKGLKKRQKQLNNPSSLSTEEMSLFAPPQERKVAHGKSLKLQRLVKDYIETSHNKKTLKEEIDNLKWELIEATLREQGKAAKLDAINALRKKHEKPFFIWKLEFSDVFRENSGFDVVIGNPPYVGERGHKEIFRAIAGGNLARYYQGKMDLYYFFFHLGIDLLKKSGFLGYITTNAYIKALGGSKLRADLKARTTIVELINFNEVKLFSSADNFCLITLLQTEINPSHAVNLAETRRVGVLSPYELSGILKGSDANTHYSKTENSKLYEGDDHYINTVVSSSSIEEILQKVSSTVLIKDYFDVTAGIQTGADKFTKKHKEGDFAKAEVGEGIYILADDELASLDLSPVEKDFFKPWYDNPSVSKWSAVTDTASSIAYIDSDVDTRTIPNVLAHLKRFYGILIERREMKNGSKPWHQLWWPRKKSVFENPKIVACKWSEKNNFSYSDTPWYASVNVSYISAKSNTSAVSDLKYLLALLNSRLLYLWLYNKGKRAGRRLMLDPNPIKNIPIRWVDDARRENLIGLVDEILQKQSNLNDQKVTISNLEQQLDDLVFDLYELTDEERQLVRDTVN